MSTRNVIKIGINIYYTIKVIYQHILSERWGGNGIFGGIVVFVLLSAYLLTVFVHWQMSWKNIFILEMSVTFLRQLLMELIKIPFVHLLHGDICFMNNKLYS